MGVTFTIAPMNCILARQELCTTASSDDDRVLGMRMHLGERVHRRLDTPLLYIEKRESIIDMR